MLKFPKSFAVGVTLSVVVGIAALGKNPDTGAAVRQTAGGSTFDLNWHTVDGGGGTSTGGGFTVHATIGQADAGLSSGGGFVVHSGYQQLAAAGAECGDCATDSNGDGVTDTADLAELLGQWGAVQPGNCLDADGDNMIDTLDLATLLGSWGECP